MPPRVTDGWSDTAVRSGGVTRPGHVTTAPDRSRGTGSSTAHDVRLHVPRPGPEGGLMSTRTLREGATRLVKRCRTLAVSSLLLVSVFGPATVASANPPGLAAPLVVEQESPALLPTRDATTPPKPPRGGTESPAGTPAKSPAGSAVMLSGSDGSESARAELIFSVIVFVLAGLGWGAAMYWLVRGRRRGVGE